MEKDFAAVVTEVDAAIGRVVEAVVSSGQGGSTVIFFSSDNGAHQEGDHKYQFFNSSGYLNGFKRSIHDGGHRAAFVVRRTGTVPAGMVSQHQLCFYDFLRTAADLAGLSAHVPPTADGMSFVPTLLGHTQEQPAFIYHEYHGCNDPDLGGVNVSRNFAQNIRMGNWSGVCVGAHAPCVADPAVPTYEGAFFLYNMAVDEAQAHNVAASNPHVVDTILAIMRQQYNHSFDPAMPNNTPAPHPPGPPSPGPHVSRPTAHAPLPRATRAGLVPVTTSTRCSSARMARYTWPPLITAARGGRPLVRCTVVPSRSLPHSQAAC